jgi:predicted HicB family RNase H-like nuclease
MLKHKGYKGKFSYDSDGDILFGRVLDVDAVITFVGSSIKEIKESFKDSVDEYLKTCAIKNIKPQKTFSGNIRLRLRPDVHKKTFLAAKHLGQSLNQFVENTLIEKIR